MANKHNTPLEDSYFELIIKTILNEVYFPGEHVDEGRVWPECPAMSMIGRRRLENVLSLAKEKIEQGVPGDFIEAGIWKGGVIALMSAVLNVYGDTGRQVYGADSFKGIPPAKPDLYPADEAHVGCDKLEILSNNSRAEVESLLKRFGLLSPQVTLVEGWFEDTLADIPNEQCALIRLDGDSYESTMQALQALYPKLSDGGSIIIDDYHSWQGCKSAVDEWRAEHDIKDPLIDVDWTGVYWTKSSKPDSSKTKIFKALANRTINPSKAEIRTATDEGLLVTPQVLVRSAWIGHLPFLTSLVGTLKPRRFVELGVHNGYSLFGAAQAVETFGLETEVVGVDLWMGDEHAGIFDAEVYDKFIEKRAAKFPSIEIIRQDFNEAVHLFEDHAIDLLHIDGLHTYEAVKSDFEAWIPKLSVGGIVLFHDTKVFRDGFGVWKLWEELQADYICYEFPHFHGLGVLINLQPIKGKPHSLSELFGPTAMTSFERAGENLGKACHAYLKQDDLQSQVRQLSEQKQHILNESQGQAQKLERESLLRGQIADKITDYEQNKERMNQALAESQNQAEHLQEKFNDKDRQLKTAAQDKASLADEITSLQEKLNEKDLQLTTSAQDKASLADEITSLQEKLDEKDLQLTTSAEDKASLADEITSLQEKLDEKDLQLKKSEQDKASLADEITSLRENMDERIKELAKLGEMFMAMSSEAEALDNEKDGWAADRGRLADNITNLSNELITIKGSLAWKLTKPLHR